MKDFLTRIGKVEVEDLDPIIERFLDSAQDRKNEYYETIIRACRYYDRMPRIMQIVYVDYLYEAIKNITTCDVFYNLSLMRKIKEVTEAYWPFPQRGRVDSIKLKCRHYFEE